MILLIMKFVIFEFESKHSIYFELISFLRISLFDNIFR